MKVVTSTDIRNIEKGLEEKYGIPPIMLMENASGSLFNFLKEHFSNLKDRKIAVLCGPGNNGGDAISLVRYFLNNGIKPKIFTYLWDKNTSSLLNIQYKLLEKESIEVVSLIENYQDLKDFDLVIDGIFGVGLSRNIEESLKDVFDFVNSIKKLVIAVDVPSGMNSDTGEIMGGVLKADVTFTMFFPKLGFFNPTTIDYIGDLKISNLGFPLNILEDFVSSRINLVEKEDLYKFLPVYSKNVHKTKKGKALIIGGSIKYTGAPILSAMSALRVDTGMVYLAVPESIHMLYRSLYPEIIILPLKDREGFISSQNIESLVSVIKDLGINAVGIGPGIGIYGETNYFVQEFLRRISIPVVVDADALSYVRDILPELNNKRMILTPHFGEMARILGTSPEDIQKNRFKIGDEFVEKYKVHLILKGPYSLTFTPEKETYINPFADSLLATAGSGDVLTGIITGLLAQGLSEKGACLLGSYTHAYSANLWKERKSSYGLIASDIIGLLPEVMEDLFKGKNALESQ
ncbi:MAG TPA: NAD(P)H-hydrate dehydratase [Dictyoglomaceae bacterium]|nr:NAD(P)H-hydrate dehydratase [Dictyoglomaceae bacterium]HOL39684.1 NAD(P)H-hydrate dehydratase [Dictyoglomaceae bacterium]HOP94780.1 NAD(P)H-hydrate dehydratase [Dictyoglomaceae bacterium]HPP16047.1 NAD(P)H-hydrate dehydratase [Dictyoglomaceae bacterium]